MELFVVNRYEGEEPKAENSNNHLNELLKRIEERKKQKAAVIDKNIAEKTDAEGNDKNITEKTDAEGNDKNITEKTDAEGNDKNIAEKTDTQSDEKVSRKKARKRKSVKSDAANEIVDDTENKEPEKNDVDAESKNAKPLIASQDFTILGSEAKKRKKVVKRVLPKWLVHPEVVSSELASGPSLNDLNDTLDSRLVDTLKANGVEKLFPVQASVIKWLVKCEKDRQRGWWPRDTCVSAPTGSGKTLAYVLPVVQHLQSRFVPKIRCLVVLPVQELAAQVYKVFVTYCAPTNLKVGLITGASSFEIEQSNIVKKTQNGNYASKVDIVIATPGRLVDHIEKTEGFCLKNLKFLVIDEADRATDWLQYIPAPHSRVPPLTLGNAAASYREFLLKPTDNDIVLLKLYSVHQPAQKLLFSATLSQDPEKLSRLGLFQPILFTSVVVTGRDDDVDLDKEIVDFAGRYTSPDELEERAVQCESEYKPLVLHQLLTANEPIEKSLVFTNSGEAAHRLALLLGSLLSKKCINVGELSAQLAPKQRSDVLDKFANGNIHVLVSSDALARGLDIPGVKLVVAYDLPKHIKGYIHRAGRTGRGGAPGTAISILTPNQTSTFSRMLSNAKKTVPTIETIDSLDDIAESVNYREHIEKLKEMLTKEQANVSEKVKASKRRHGTKRLGKDE